MRSNLTLMSSCDRDCGVGAIVVCGLCEWKTCGIKSEGCEAGQVVEGVWRWVTGQLSYSPAPVGVDEALMALVRGRWGRGGAREEKLKMKGWLRVAEIPRLRGVS